MKKFWNKAATTNDIYIYGDIVGERWDDSEVTAKSFLEDLKACKNQPVNLHINSNGGDVFQALAIYNSLKNYEGNVNVIIDGIAASAASLIICAGDNVKMASNALIMIHLPQVGLMGYYNSAELEKIQNSLRSCEGAILETYKSKLPEKNHSDVAQMMTEEKYFTAEEAKAIGFVDEITGEVEMEVDDARGLLIVNKVEFDCKKLGKINLQGVKKLEKKIEVPANETLDVKQTNELLIKDAIKQAREQEIQRIKNLMTLRGDNAAVNAIIEVAMAEGAEVSDVKKYIDAVKSVKVETPKNSAVEEIKAAIRDNMTSGAENVGGSIQTATAEDEREKKAKMLAEIANSLRGVKRG